jgi:hypothetical protein
VAAVSTPAVSRPAVSIAPASGAVVSMAARPVSVVSWARAEPEAANNSPMASATARVTGEWGIVLSFEYERSAVTNGD